MSDRYLLSDGKIIIKLESYWEKIALYVAHLYVLEENCR